MYIRIRLFAVICLLFPCTQASGQVVRLADLEELALRRHPEMETSRAKVRQTEAAIDVARTTYHPTLSLGIDGSASPGGQLISVIPKDDTTTYLVQGTRALGDPGAFYPAIRYGTVLSFQGYPLDFGRKGAATRAA